MTNPSDLFFQEQSGDDGCEGSQIVGMDIDIRVTLEPFVFILCICSLRQGLVHLLRGTLDSKP
jgi:hypothetical protein